MTQFVILTCYNTERQTATEYITYLDKASGKIRIKPLGKEATNESKQPVHLESESPAKASESKASG